MDLSIAERLSIRRLSNDDCLAAIRGERIPFALGLPLIRLSIVHGIRYQAESAKEEFAKELYSIDPIFTRALNARRIMSNSLDLLPEHFKPEEIPYCIWHPRTASESTYRELVARYPQFKYQVGRACAVANYPTLYSELDILPDVHIAEEARECGSTEIFETIMAAPARFDVMDDYNRSVRQGRAEQACLDGNTAVRWSLDVKQKFTQPRFDEAEESFGLFDDDGFEDNVFDITEDMNIDEYGICPLIEVSAPRYDIAALLSEPLPRDLPTTEKDLLILVAAHDGDIDRYARLRRPQMIKSEMACCVRGIYHNTRFGLWWSRQSQPPEPILLAINARLIMNNVLSPITKTTDQRHLPYLIWYPTVAEESTYRELYRRKPEMAPQILKSCIAGGYKPLFEHVLSSTTPDLAVRLYAGNNSDQFYKEKLAQRLSDLGIHPEPYSKRAALKELGWSGEWKTSSTAMLNRSSNGMLRYVSAKSVGTTRQPIYNGCDGSNISQLELMICLPEEWKHGGHSILDYESWPPQTD